MVATIDLGVYKNVSENNQWECESFDAVKGLYADQTIEEKVQKVKAFILNSMTAADQIRGHLGLDFITAVQKIQQDRDSKRSPEMASVPELIGNATPLERFVTVKVIQSVSQALPSIHKADIVAASLLFGIRQVREEVQSLSAVNSPQPEQVIPLREQIAAALNKLKMMRSQFAGNHEFLAQVDQMIAVQEQKLAELS